MEGNTCDSVKLANDTCDDDCYNLYCNFDNNACGGEFCNSNRCHTSMIQNEICDENCLSADCNYDGGDCECAPGCFNFMLEDTEC